MAETEAKGFMNMRWEVYALQLGHVPALLPFLNIFTGRKAGPESLFSAPDLHYFPHNLKTVPGFHPLVPGWVHAKMLRALLHCEREHRLGASVRALLPRASSVERGCSRSSYLLGFRGGNVIDPGQPGTQETASFAESEQTIFRKDLAPGKRLDIPTEGLQ